ncbi:MAG TPA: hypothetical protein VL068_14890, partial [Microthrixaceae bacterium]|nr:hypothetical protein [Microthrixaceae bacterium]
ANTYTATAGVIAPKLDTSLSPEILALNKIHMQAMFTLPVSEAYAAKLKKLAQLDLSVPEIQDRMSVDRPKFGALIQFTFGDTNEKNTLVFSRT